MALIAAKFGGSSLCEGRMFVFVKRLISSDSARRAIVVSAPGKRWAGDEKITDLLIEYEQKRDDALWQSVAARFSEIARALECDIQGALDDIRARILSGAGRAYAASRGEYMSARLLAHALDYEFLDASECVRFSECGALNYEATYMLMSARARVERGVVLPGFYGASPTGRITTFPRGGSDITGALIARALNADVYENWTDVDGVYTQDPARADGARLIERISYHDMLALCLSGAHVLHPGSLAPIMEKRIPLNVRNTFNPDASGTWIT